MVASTSVSAFADDTNISSYEEGSNTANVTINGAVEGNDGQIPSGTINVSVPTALNFSVNKSGGVNGGNIIITNRGVEPVDITAVNFEDQTFNSKITVKAPGDLQKDSQTRDNLVLSIGGNKGERAFFKSEDAGSSSNGIYNSKGVNEPSGIKISTINGSGDSDTLTLTGYAGEGSLSNDEATKGITDTFILRLKVSKA